MDLAIMTTMNSVFTDKERNGARMMCTCLSCNSRVQRQPDLVEKHSESHSRHISYRLDVYLSQTFFTVHHSLYSSLNFTLRSVLKIGREAVGLYIQKTTSNNSVLVCLLHYHRFFISFRHKFGIDINWIFNCH